MNEQTPLIQKQIQLEKFPGKGGWTFVRIPEIPQDRQKAFGMRKVNGFIDSYELKDCNLMPMGKGQLFLPLKAAIRKHINKEAGEWVELILYSANTGPTLNDFLLCLEDDPEAMAGFETLSDEDRNAYTDWIFSARTEEDIINRMGEAISKLANGEKPRFK